MEKKYPIGGYAPGNYHNRCCTCERSFFGDKRAVQCEPCAVKSLREILRPYNQATATGAVFPDLLKAQDEYAQLLTDEINELIGIASVHGWRSTRHEKGKELRERIAMLKKAQPAQQGAVWVKASDRLPGWDKLTEWRFAGKEPTAKETVRFLFSAANLHQWEWLDETGQSQQPGREVEFAEWLQKNRWCSFENGKWYYTFEQGTAMSDKAYQKNYVKTTTELYEVFKKEVKP